MAAKPFAQRKSPHESGGFSYPSEWNKIPVAERFTKPLINNRSQLMLKIFSFILIVSLLLPACSSQWNPVDPNMPEELRTQHETILEEQLLILEEDPENENALFEVAFRYHQLGYWKKAVSYYEEVLKVNPENWAAINNLASIYEKVEDYEQAAEYIKTLYQIDQTNIEVIKDTVRILLKAGDPVNAEHALQNFEKLTLDPAAPDPKLQELITALYEDIHAATD